MNTQLFINPSMYTNVRDHLDDWRNSRVIWDNRAVLQDFLLHVKDPQAVACCKSIFGDIDFFDILLQFENTQKPTYVSKLFYDKFDHEVWKNKKFTTQAFFRAMAHVETDEWLELTNTQRVYWLTQALEHIAYVANMKGSNSTLENTDKRNDQLLDWMKVSDPVIGTLLQTTRLSEEDKNTIAPFIIAFPHWLVMAQPRIEWPLTRATLYSKSEYTAPKRMMVNFNRMHQDIELLSFSNLNCAWGYADYSFAQAIMDQRSQAWTTCGQIRMPIPQELQLIIENANPQTLQECLRVMEPGHLTLPYIPVLDMSASENMDSGMV